MSSESVLQCMLQEGFSTINVSERGVSAGPAGCDGDRFSVTHWSADSCAGLDVLSLFPCAHTLLGSSHRDECAPPRTSTALWEEGYCAKAFLVSCCVLHILCLIRLEPRNMSARTKTSSIVNKALAAHFMRELVVKMREQPHTLITDGSNDSGVSQTIDHDVSHLHNNLP